MSRVRAYLSERLVSAVRKTQLEIPIHPVPNLSAPPASFEKPRRFVRSRRSRAATTRFSQTLVELRETPVLAFSREFIVLQHRCTAPFTFPLGEIGPGSAPSDTVALRPCGRLEPHRRVFLALRRDRAPVATTPPLRDPNRLPTACLIVIGSRWRPYECSA